MTTYRNVALIYNPYAGRLRGKRVDLVRRVADLMSAAGHRVTSIPTEGPQTAAGLARRHIERGADLVIALGGDGTLNEAMNGVAHSPVPLAVVPAGTANVLARELGLGCDTLRAARRLDELVPLRVAIGRLYAEPQVDRYFLLMAGVGFDAHIVYNLNLPLKFRFGQVAYWLGAARAALRLLEAVEVHVGGEVYQCAFALASRVRNYAGYLSIARRASLLRDDFEIVLFEASSALKLYARYLAPVLSKRPSNVRGMSFLTAHEAEFRGPTDGRVYVQVDGEYAGRLPARVEVVPGALTLLVPPGFATTG
jgi:diacylglycerol kinase family enzyme